MTVLKDNMIAYWKFDEESGTRVDAYSDFDLADINTVLYAVGKIGNAANFELDNAEYLKRTAAIMGAGIWQADWSIACWIKPESHTTTSAIFYEGNTATDTPFGGVELLTDGNLRINVRNNASEGVSFQTTTAPISDGTWYYVVFAATGTIAYIYVNGTLRAQGAFAPTGALSQDNATVGTRLRTSASNYYDGLIDELGIWSAPLPSGEVWWLYNNGAGRSYAEIQAWTPRGNQVIMVG